DPGEGRPGRQLTISREAAMWRTKVQLPNAPVKVRIGGSVAVGAPVAPAPATKAQIVGNRSSAAIPLPSSPEPEPEPPPPEPVVQHDPRLLQLLESIQQT